MTVSQDYLRRKVLHTTMGRWLFLVSMLFVFIIGTGGAFAFVRQTNSVPVLPANFVQEPVVAGLKLPTDIAFLPNGDMLISEKGQGGENGAATIYLVQDVVGDPILTDILTVETNPTGDAGVLGIVPDPNFATNFHFYIYYTTVGSANENPALGTSVNRVSRFTYKPATQKVDPASEQIILDGIPRGLAHNGGALTFDDDGNLYILTGDYFSFAFKNHPSPNLTLLSGKVLRIRPNSSGYTIPNDNPFINTPNARPEIYARGLRSPFRLTRSTEGDILFGDVGHGKWEEINRIEAGVDYGWPEREGPCPYNQQKPCPASSADQTDPVIYYPHAVAPNVPGGAITGLAFYEGDAFPTEYHDKLFFVDYNNRWMGVTTPDGTMYEAPHFAENIGRIVDLAYHDNALYTLDIETGRVLRIFYAGPGQPPVATIAADTTFSTEPVTVTFTADNLVSASTVANYQWTFGDGAMVTTGVPTVAHRYHIDGDYTASVVIEDTDGQLSAPASVLVQVYTGELPEIALTNLTDAARAQFWGGDLFEYVAERSTVADLDAQTPYSWRIDLLHNNHVHPFIVGNEVVSDTFEISAENHNSVSLSYRFQLFMHTASGQTIQSEKTIFPEQTTVTIEAVAPITVTASINGINGTLPIQERTLVGMEQRIDLPPILVSLTDVYVFEQWTHDAALGVSGVISAEPNNPTYQATYQFDRPAERLWLPVVAAPR